MESTHGQLCTWLTDRLCSDDTDGLTNLYRLTGSHVCAIALRTHTNLTLTAQDGTDLNLLNSTSGNVVYTLFHDTCSTLRSDHVVCFYKDFALFILNGLAGETTCDTILKALDLLLAIHETFYIHTGNLCSVLTAVHLTYDQILRYVNKTSCQVTGIGCTKSGIGKSFTSSMSGHEIFQYVQTLTEV